MAKKPDQILELTPQERTEEALKRWSDIKLLMGCGGWMKNENTSEFWRDIDDRLQRYGLRTMVSVRQLRWLRGINSTMKKQTKGQVPQ